MLCLGWTGRAGAQGLNKPQVPQQQVATVLPVDLPFPTGQITHWVFSFLPCLQALMGITSLKAKNFPCQRKLLI